MNARSLFPCAALALALLAVSSVPPAHSQAMIEASGITSQSATTERPDWARDNPSAPASRFVVGGRAGIADGSWFKSVGLEAGGFSNMLRSGGAYGGGGQPAAPARRARPKSGAPGRVAGLVYESGTMRPVAGVIVRMVSTEPQYVVERIDARTDSAGYYEFPRIEPGAWRLGIVSDRLATRYAPPRTSRAVTVSKRDSIAAPPFELKRTACVAGHAGWSDGYVLYDAPLTIAPYDSTQFSSTVRMNGLGDFDVCNAPEDSVMVWMHLRDGRSLGRTTRLSNGFDRRVLFQPDPLERMEGCLLRVLPVLNDGTPVPRAKVTMVGRRFEQGARPALVFVREQVADADGVAEFKVPFGVYEVLAMNPREGQTGRVQRMVVDTDQAGAQPLRIELRGTATVAERASMRADLLDRAETYLYVWTQ